MRKINLKTIAYHIDMLADLGFDIKSIDIETGTFTAVMPTYQSGELTSYEREECAKGKIHGIKAVRETRGMGLADAKAFVEAHYNFPPSQSY
jgi:hypothetical protein